MGELFAHEVPVVMLVRQLAGLTVRGPFVLLGHSGLEINCTEFAVEVIAEAG